MKEIIENVKLSAVIPYERNARKNDAAVKEVVKSIERTGYRTPIIVDENMVILCGHTRAKALAKMGWKEIPFVVQYTDLSEEQKQEYRIRDNKTGEIAEWDFEILEADFSSDELIDFGFDIKDLTQPEVEEDEAPPVPEIARTVEGDIYTLGNHRVMCGDSTMIDDVEKLMDGKKADMVFTSPPYNANSLMSDGGVFDNPSVKMYNKMNDKKETNDYVKFIQDVLEICFIFTDGFIFWNINYNNNSKFEYIKHLEKRIDYLVEQICWKKSSTIPFKGCLKREWEPIYVFSTNKQNLGVKNVSPNFWDISNQNTQIKEHKACFPVGLPLKGIELVNKNTGIVFEPFCGSGTTLIACEQTNRICYGMELDEKYCDVIVQRWVNFTGGKVILNGEEIEWSKSDVK
jgi:DNA modification methylase